MMLILAWRNIWRNKRRSAVILIATAAGLAGGLFAIGVFTGLYESMVQTALDRGLGELQVHTVGFQKDQLIGQYLPAADSIEGIVAAHPDVRAFALHTIAGGMASSASAAAGISIMGVDPDRERTVTSISRRIVEGGYLDRPNGVVIGHKLAGKLKLKLHARLILSFAGLDGNFLSGAFRIEGIFKTDASTFDGATVFVRREDLSALLGSSAPVHEIVIRTAQPQRLEHTQSDLQRLMPASVRVETWKELSPELKLTAESTDFTNAIFLGIILFALVFGLTNTLLMSVLDRVKDFGVLLAVGMHRAQLFLMIMLESLCLSFTGGIAGVAAGWMATQLFHAEGIDLSMFSAGLAQYGIPSILYPTLNPSVYGTLTLMMVAASVAAGLYPALKAIRLQPIEAIRSIG